MMIANKKNNTSNRMYVSLLLLALLGAAATNHVADAVFAATPASPARDQGEGWYFREYAIEVGSNPGPGAGPGPLLATSPEYLRNFYPGSISLIGDLANVNVICPAGYHSAGCIGGTVPAGIGNLQLSGGLSTELAAGPGLLSSRPSISEGFNKFTGCGATVRFNYPIPRDYLYQSNYVFLKVEAYCQKDRHPTPTPKPPYVKPVPPYVKPVPPYVKPVPPYVKPVPPYVHPVPPYVHPVPPYVKPVPPYVHPVPPSHPIYDPCNCAQQRSPLGCIGTNACATGTVCYVNQRCPGFSASQNPERIGQFYQCVSLSQCR